MSQVIRIPTTLYKRLERHAKGFDTPANIIERILSFYENQKKDVTAVTLRQTSELPTSLEIIYYPSGETNFKRALLESKKAYVLLHKTDGSQEFYEWNASKFTEHSDVNGNLRSGYLRNWKDKEIYKAEIAINKEALSLESIKE